MPNSTKLHKPSLFDSLVIGDLTLPNRVVMAPLTRMRSKQPGNIPWELNSKYYAQRASAGLIISEATQVSQQGQGYPGTPGIHTAEQVNGWRLVTDAVHSRGGRIFLQLWHVGRISHSSYQPDGGPPVAPSAIKPSGKVHSADWQEVDFETPRALSSDDIPEIVEQFRTGATMAKQAGFDGVEVHGANGYLLDQFINDGSNKREDRYGGSVENRARLLLEVVDAVCTVWDRGRVGVRLSPFGAFNDMHDSNPKGTFGYVIAELNNRGIGYLHLIEPRASFAGGSDALQEDVQCTSSLFRSAFNGPLISAGGYTPESAMEAVSSGQADAVAFGRFFISNPDLPERIRKNADLNNYNRATFYGGDSQGYTDYPRLNES